jgi:hypothetical protein
MLADIEPLLFKARRALIKNPGDEGAKSLLSWCVFHLQENKADLPKDLMPFFKKLGEDHDRTAQQHRTPQR